MDRWVLAQKRLRGWEPLLYSDIHNMSSCSFVHAPLATALWINLTFHNGILNIYNSVTLHCFVTPLLQWPNFGGAWKTVRLSSSLIDIFLDIAFRVDGQILAGLLERQERDDWGLFDYITTLKNGDWAPNFKWGTNIDGQELCCGLIYYLILAFSILLRFLFILRHILL